MSFDACCRVHAVSPDLASYTNKLMLLIHGNLQAVAQPLSSPVKYTASHGRLCRGIAAAAAAAAAGCGCGGEGEGDCLGWGLAGSCNTCFGPRGTAAVAAQRPWAAEHEHADQADVYFL
eukprot:361183-Chlamydomonas_euryale.AAC.3